MRGQVFLVVLALVQLPGFALSAYGVERWGRKPTLIGFLLLSAVGCMLYSLGSPFVVIGSTLLMSFSLLGTWGALYAFTPEVYPTDLRASGMGMAGAVARFGGLFARPSSRSSWPPTSPWPWPCCRRCWSVVRWRSGRWTWSRAIGRWIDEGLSDRFSKRPEGLLLLAFALELQQLIRSRCLPAFF
jgi:MFS family permease